MKSFQNWLVALIVGGAVVGGTPSVAEKTLPTSSFRSVPLVTAPGSFPFRPPLFVRPVGRHEQLAFPRHGGRRRWNPPVANVAATLVPADQLPE